MFKLEIKTDNAAFEDGQRDYEIERILRSVKNRTWGRTEAKGSLRDSNGNVIGHFELTED